ncbi:MAG: zeta toxin family protein [Planctomycetia bacterium]|nr:zeta toxin family protein [Planctomycetia bacterium]
MKKRVVIIAGPNGAGKTTFAREFLLREAQCPDFINADLIAQGLSPLVPEAAAIEAARIMLERMDKLAAVGKSFAFETTLAGRTYVHRIREWQAAGYAVKIVFLRLPSVELALHRVKSRVMQGGHDVPAGVVRARFTAGWKNFLEIYRPLVEEWIIYDCSGDTPQPLEFGESA